MIHDAKIEVECDSRVTCGESIDVPLPFVYSGVMHANGNYDHSEATVEKLLVEHSWIVRDGKHYCSEHCAKYSEEPAP